MGRSPAIEALAVPIVVGSGIAGLSTALSLGRCLVITKGGLASGSSELAQGGIAMAAGPDDSPAAHAADTIAVGGGLVDELVATMVAGEGPAHIEWLEGLGARFDKTGAGALHLGREAGHSHHRIVHAHGDATGREVMKTLRAAVRARSGITVLERAEVVDLVRSRGRVVGVMVVDEGGTPLVLLAPAVVLATGGIGRIYSRTTNPAEATGDGLAVAVRAGAAIRDVEFVQFHPTALDGPEDPLPLLTEALRGAGAVLIDAGGRRFMPAVHPDAELAPRDIVSRAVWRETANGRAFLDATSIGTSFPEAFPTVFGMARAAGYDPRFEPLPVTPAAHYHMGGVVTDDGGRTSLPGLYACGEVAATGLHGANRLASNSLLEGLVFAARVAEAVGTAEIPVPGDEIEVPTAIEYAGTEPVQAVTELRDAMWDHVGVVRDRDGLVSALESIERLTPGLETSVTGRNLATIARLITSQALARTESRGSHFRRDYPKSGAFGSATIVPRAVATAAIDGTARVRVDVA